MSSKVEVYLSSIWVNGGARKRRIGRGSGESLVWDPDRLGEGGVSSNGLDSGGKGFDGAVGVNVGVVWLTG